MHALQTKEKKTTQLSTVQISVNNPTDFFFYRDGFVDGGGLVRASDAQAQPEAEVAPNPHQAVQHVLVVEHAGWPEPCAARGRVLRSNETGQGDKKEKPAHRRVRRLTFHTRQGF